MVAFKGKLSIIKNGAAVYLVAIVSNVNIGISQYRTQVSLTSNSIDILLSLHETSRSNTMRILQGEDKGLGVIFIFF